MIRWEGDKGDGALTYWVALLIVALDQGVKWLVTAHMRVGESIPVWRGVLDILYVQNRGAAFSILTNQEPFLVAVALLVVVIAVFVERRFGKGKTGLRIALGALLGGAVGNLVDRVLRGYVVDYIYVQAIHYPVFNLADSSIVLSVIYLIARAWFLRPKEEPGPDSPPVRPAGEE